jgi:hypothetical protein
VAQATSPYLPFPPIPQKSPHHSNLSIIRALRALHKIKNLFLLFPRKIPLPPKKRCAPGAPRAQHPRYYGGLTMRAATVGWAWPTIFFCRVGLAHHLLLGGADLLVCRGPSCPHLLPWGAGFPACSFYSPLPHFLTFPRLFNNLPQNTGGLSPCFRGVSTRFQGCFSPVCGVFWGWFFPFSTAHRHPFPLPEPRPHPSVQKIWITNAIIRRYVRLCGKWRTLHAAS